MDLVTVKFVVALYGKQTEVELSPQQAYAELAKIYGAVPEVSAQNPCKDPVCGEVCEACAPAEPEDRLLAYVRGMRKSQGAFLVSLKQLESLCGGSGWRVRVAMLPIRNVSLYATAVTGTSIPCVLIHDNPSLSVRDSVPMSEVPESLYSQTTVNLIKQRICKFGVSNKSTRLISGTLREIGDLLMPGATEDRVLSYLIYLDARRVLTLNTPAEGQYKIVYWD